MGVTAGKANHRLCRCCMTVKFSGAPNKVLRRRNMDCLAYVKLFKPSFYCVAEIMFLSQAKLSDFKNIVFFERAKAINISATTNEPQYASKFSTDIIIAPENRCDSFFWIKKTFCNSEINQPNGHISISPSRDILDTFPL